eukprot:SAG25_NODE_1069_length_4127_cov_3.215438_4_plen_116_part_00
MVVLTSVRVRDGWRRIRHIPKPNRKKFVQRTTMEVTVSAAEVSYLFIGGAAPLFPLSLLFRVNLAEQCTFVATRVARRVFQPEQFGNKFAGAGPSAGPTQADHRGAGLRSGIAML